MTTRKISAPTTSAAPQQHTRTQNANPRHTLDTSIGRKIVYQECGPLERFNLMGILGSQFCTNQATLGTALFICGIRDIDGTPVMFPEDKMMFENLLLRAGDDCLIAIQEFMVEQYKLATGVAGLTEDELDLSGK